MLLPDGYIKQLTDAAHEVGAIFVLDCVAAGALWTDMQVLGIDVLITAPTERLDVDLMRGSGDALRSRLGADASY